jgi:hypothetical protein
MAAWQSSSCQGFPELLSLELSIITTAEDVNAEGGESLHRTINWEPFQSFATSVKPPHLQIPRVLEPPGQKTSTAAKDPVTDLEVRRQSSGLETHTQACIRIASLLAANHRYFPRREVLWPPHLLTAFQILRTRKNIRVPLKGWPQTSPFVHPKNLPVVNQNALFQGPGC